MQCGWKGKTSYSRDEALRALRRLQQLDDDPDVERLNVYRCSSCGRWHVGHKAVNKRAS